LANPKERPKLGPFFILGLFFLVYYGLPLSWKITAQSTFDEFHAPIWDLTSRLSDLSYYWGHQADSKNTLISKNRDLARLRADWEIKNDYRSFWQQELENVKQAKAHLTSLRQEIGLDGEQFFDPIISRVTRRSLAAWWQELSLRKGSDNGIWPGMGVVYSAGIAGKIVSSSSNSSRVELVSNSSFRVAARIEGDDRPVTFQGAGILAGGQPIGVVLDVPHDIATNNKSPIWVQTCDLGGTFPNGLRIGTIDHLEDSGDGLFKTGRVFISADLGKVSEVTILAPIPFN
jgi:rod shape-determining protein MreC